MATLINTLSHPPHPRATIFGYKKNKNLNDIEESSQQGRGNLKAISLCQKCLPIDLLSLIYHVMSN